MSHYELLKVTDVPKKKKDKSDAAIIDRIIQTILANDPRQSKKSPIVINEKLPKDKLKFLLNKVKTTLLREATLLEIEPPIVIFGDTHGQFGDLLDIIDNVGWVPEKRFLFMGDYVDRGDNSIELISLLFALKVRYPDNIYLLRGNHETAEVNVDYGFKVECLRDYDLFIWHAFQECFNCLPLVALISKEILCMHGGLSPSLAYVEDVKKICRPLDVPEEGWVCDVLWADPIPPKEHQHTKSTSAPQSSNCCGFSPNGIRGTSVWFGPDAVEEFFKRNELDLIVRGHEMVESGYEFSTNKKVLTIFSAPNYCQHPNDASVLSIDDELNCFIWVFKFPHVPAPPPSDLKNVEKIVNVVSLKEAAPFPKQPQDLWNEVTLRSKQGEDGANDLKDFLEHSSGEQAKTDGTKMDEKPNGPIAEKSTKLSCHKEKTSSNVSTEKVQESTSLATEKGKSVEVKEEAKVKDSNTINVTANKAKEEVAVADKEKYSTSSDAKGQNTTQLVAEKEKTMETKSVEKFKEEVISKEQNSTTVISK